MPFPRKALIRAHQLLAPGGVRLAALLGVVGFELLEYAVSERYRVGMELVARKPR